MEDITPPPDGLYASYEEARNALKSHGTQHGYGFRIWKSIPHNSDVKTRYYYLYDQSGTYQSKAMILRTSTRIIECPFKLVIFKIKDNDQWKLEVQDKHHNHGPSLNPTAHNVYHRRTLAQKDIIKSMTHAGVRPIQIMAALQKEDPDTLVSATDIRSERKAIREKHLNGRSPIETSIYRPSSLQASASSIMRHKQTTIGQSQTSSSRQGHQNHACLSAIRRMR